MAKPHRTSRRSRRPAPVHPRPGAARGRLARAWPGLAVVALVLATAAILLVHQQPSGPPAKVRRELRKF